MYGLTTARRFALALLLASAAPAAAQVQPAPGILSFNGRRSPITLLPSDLSPPSVYRFTADGVATTFQLSVLADASRIAVFLSGFPQAPDAFSVAVIGGRSTIIFAAPPPQGVTVTAAIGALPATLPAAPPAANGVPQVFDFTGGGVTMSFPLPAAPISLDRYRIAVGGVVQSRADCQLTSSALVCGAPPPATTPIEVVDGP